ncbi:MAG: hypothetical protein JOY91_05980 [Sinobacteraceae bacterium]|nr:hypothetical protein [Nevskiaceae bacterium]
MPLTELEAQLRPTARERIALGILPCEVPSQIWAGKGSGRCCDLCDQAVAAHEIEYEIEHLDANARRSVFVFHIVCQSIWQLECARYQHLKQQQPASVP